MNDTATLIFREAGLGFPVVLLHGFPFDHTIWSGQQDALSEAYRVIAPDLRGHGQSPVPAGVYTMDACARDVLALLDTLDIERAVWAGHSMGGYITMAALRLAPERIAGVALVATHPHPDTDDKRQGRLATAQQVLDEGSGVMVEAMRPNMFAPQFDTGSEVAQAIYDVMRSTAPPAVAGALRGMAQRPDSVPTLRELSVPAAVFAGADDQIVSLDVARGMVDAMPDGTTLDVIPDAGHLLMIEQPAALSDALRAWLEARF